MAGTAALAQMNASTTLATKIAATTLAKVTTTTKLAEVTTTAAEAATAPTEQGNIFVGCLWFVMIAFMFFAQHHVCDAYFVPAINVFVETMRKSPMKCAKRWGEEAVAGATICALGCNGPELFTNLISLYTCSDAGIGVVVGSEIFNLLIIVGCATLAAPIVPLALERVPFARDCTFYAISIVLLYLFMQDKKIHFIEASILLTCCVVYVCTVYFTTDLVNCIPFLRPNPADLPLEGQAGGKETGRMHGVHVEVKQVFHSRMTDAQGETATNIDMAPQNDAFRCVGKPVRKPNARGSTGFQLADPNSLLGDMLSYDDLVEVAVMEAGSLRLEFQYATLLVKAENADKRKELLEKIEIYDNKVWVHKYDATVVGAFEHLQHAWTGKSNLVSKLLSIPEFLIDCPLKATLFWADVKDITKENRWPLCFGGAMFWLAVFSFSMLEIANQIHDNIPSIPTAFLGITVCAIGTSFPNAVASVIMASQNKPAAAIANALGSNVQNVFLAMAFPWVIFMLAPGTNCETGKPAKFLGTLDQNVQGLTQGIEWMIGTLVLVLIFVLLPGVCTLNKVYGSILIGVYFVYLGLTSYQTFSSASE